MTDIIIILNIETSKKSIHEKTYELFVRYFIKITSQLILCYVCTAGPFFRKSYCSNDVSAPLVLSYLHGVHNAYQSRA